ncbi:hypothetical protein JAAARDRAFT_220840 [Jaapia argillacea MUCL 33604]|uniref:Uncharacterized protein n=1 Tax=Jaapia argillacea MUCL 33604 TaxID=933084 RepID=A0A067QDL2_9AGAM|nr:hypothetical protein JAAARDRAFT_220840 [Jaapia argillacea MUCL 33604]
MQFASYQTRFALHALLVLACAITCVLILVYENPFPLQFPTAVYGPFAPVTVGTYAVGILIIAASNVITIVRKGSIVSNVWFESAWLLALIGVSIVGLIEYKPRLLIGYLLVFGPTVTACSVFVSWVLQVAVAVFSLSLIALLARSVFSTRTLGTPRATEPFWFHNTETRNRRVGSPFCTVVTFIVGVPRPTQERHSLIHDALGNVIFKHTIFRKHPFESATLALVRGLIGSIAITAATSPFATRVASGIGMIGNGIGVRSRTEPHT